MDRNFANEVNTYDQTLATNLGHHAARLDVNGTKLLLDKKKSNFFECKVKSTITARHLRNVLLSVSGNKKCKRIIKSLRNDQTKETNKQKYFVFRLILSWHAY